ncbi:MAG: 50S ribosomal protein L17 [Phycisphaeraceae bacterium]|nr:50S ribosomal protein L17 [Phycisphaeraceae bacterium]
MHHRIAGFKLGRDAEHRLALRRNLAIALLTHGQITTTLQKAKSVQPLVEKLITLAKRGDLTSRRRVIRAIGDPIMVKFDEDPDVNRNRFGEIESGPRLVKHVFDVVGPRFRDRNGGYTRVVRLGKHRIGDAGDLVVLQFVGEETGPQVAGQYSRRRQKANRRMEFAAKLRKAATPAAPAPTPAE